MNILEVSCINKVVHSDPRHRITHLGGYGWHDTQREVIKAIEAKTHTFFVNVPGADKVLLVVRVSPYGHKYVKTLSDGEMPNNLLSLPECK